MRQRQCISIPGGTASIAGLQLGKVGLPGELLRQAPSHEACCACAAAFQKYDPPALENLGMAAISSQSLAQAALRLERMDFQQRQQLAEEIHDKQPNLFFSVLVQQRYGASLQQIEVLLNLLLLFYEGMKCSGHEWPVISEDVQERCLARVSGRVRFTEGLSPELQAKATTDAIENHPEELLLAHVFGTFKESGMLGIRTETEKMLMLAALNLVECIAEAAPRTST